MLINHYLSDIKLESADTHLLLTMMMTMLRFYQAMPPVSPLILRGLNCHRILIHQEPLIVPPKLKCLLGESAREDQKQLVVRRKARSVTKNVPSNDSAGKSTDTEEVERQLYLENSSGAVFTPPEIDVLVGGKCKGGPTTTIVLWWCTDLSYSIGKWGRTKRMLETGIVECCWHW